MSDLRPQNLPSRAELIAICATLTAIVAFSIDAMLPTLPEIATELSPDSPNRAQLVISAFVFGLGIGTLFVGPLSDRFGRKPIIVGGGIVFVAGALAAWQADSLNMLLLARGAQGLGAAAPRIVTLAIVRDLFAGRGMAKIVSFIMLVFTLIPAMAPTIGAGIIALSGWRELFLVFVLFSILGSGWLMLRIPETLAPENRRPFRPLTLWGSLMEIMRHPIVRTATLAQCLAMGVLFTTIINVQPIFEHAFERGHSFHFWFGGIAVFAAGSNLLNAALVERLGMRRLVAASVGLQIGLSGAVLILLALGTPTEWMFAVFVFWQWTLFFMAGMTLGNLNAIALEPMAHMAGSAASVILSLATVAAMILAVPVGLLFDGTPKWMAVSILLQCSVALALMIHMRRLEERV